ncbi:MAG: protein CapI [Rhodospirillaceae bacterium TMED8]|nr:protein CapI [Magnetovibrio sp.]OUT50168.1 MAG: protein CapI [Rhodospirillaceae bacterium TMED8]
MAILVTGVAGFIGASLSHVLLDQGREVVGIDNVNDYYDPILKETRLDRLRLRDGFTFHKMDIADRTPVEEVFTHRTDISGIVHLAGQAGVRYSLVNPYAYTHSNIEGHLVLMEAARRLRDLKHFVYASSSSVYGANTDFPFSVGDRTDCPVSLYAATKKSMELMSEAYARMWMLPMTGLRFFTVYGPWGRPDMAAFIFIQKMLAGQAIPVFNNGDMKRDFTYIDDIVSGVVGCLDRPPITIDGGNEVPHAVYNIGNNKSENLMDFIAILERELGIKADIDFKPMQPGDVRETFADIESTRRDFGFEPTVTIAEGLPKVVSWYRDYYG